MNKQLSKQYQVFLLAFVFLGLYALPGQAQQYYLSLEKQHINLPNRTYYVGKVVDGRPGKPTIGLVYRGLDNRPAAVLFRDGLETELTSFLQKQLPARSTDQAIVLCLRQLRISEVLNGFTEEASADLAADVYAHLPDGYHFVQSVAARTSERALETTYRHDNQVAQLLQQCLEQLQSASWQEATARPPLTLAQLTKNATLVTTTSTGISSTPAIIREAPRRGIYYSFAQFLANQADATHSILLDTIHVGLAGPTAREQWQGVARIRPQIVEAEKRRSVPKDIWGFSDGQQVYVQYQGRYFPLVRQRNFFTFVGEAQPDLEYMRARSQAQMRTGVIGVATVREQNHTDEPTGYAVDMRTGHLAPYPDPMRPYPAKTDTAYVYVYRTADSLAEPVPVFLGDRQVGQLRSNEYLEIPWPYYARVMRLGVQTAGKQAAQLLIPNTSQLNYVRIMTNTATSLRPSIQLVRPEQGEKELDAIDKLSPLKAK
ncbi:hypothetical protein SAMN06265337_2744 [Hymenobacter gelipurpurascens]|uniref:Uncharacterized protein n=1 Tax=Hymenobacter gelipurpurascens TaxID=89968 RepID=A0A212UAK1_9BACT|nr:hypothetical protein [Hymenobacter gelipurpurascens]SNC75180.1 hypothetical protein SAMN06265337_2744 [Hymenobacter gelipurpurascens]